jgi:hypothetical protein
LKLSCGSEAWRAATEHCRPALIVLERHICSHRAATPSKRHPSAAETVVVDQSLGIEFLSLQNEARITMRA